MTPSNKVKFKNNSQMRFAPIFNAQVEKKLIDTNYYIEGYAARFEPYVLFTEDGVDYYEQFVREGFANCDMTDIIYLYDHQGKVLARQSNGTLIVEVRDDGLFFAADLGKTEAARTLYDEICAGMITKMSWRFAIGDYEYDPETRTFTHYTVKKIYDVTTKDDNTITTSFNVAFIKIENGKEITYNFDNKVRTYITDFYLPQFKYIIELKAKNKFYRDDLKSGKIEAKNNACIDYCNKNTFAGASPVSVQVVS